MDKVWQVGLIGCGAIARKKHLPLCRQLPQIHLRGLFSRNGASARSCAAEFGDEGTQVFETLEDLLDCDDIEVIIICSPNCAHAAQAIAALEHGKHVLCEKPMAMNTAEGKAMLEAAQRNRKLLHFSYQNRYSDHTQLAKSLVDQGLLDRIYCAKAYALRRRALPTWPGTTQKDVTGGGPLMDIGSHAIDLALYLSGNFRPKYCIGTTYNHLARRGSSANFWGSWDPERYELEDSALGFVVMEDGMTLTVEASYAMNLEEEKEAAADILGTGAGLTLRQETGVTLIREECGQMLQTHPVTQHTPRNLTPDAIPITPALREYQAVLALLNSGATEDPAAWQAYIVLRIVEGIYESARTGAPYFFDSQ